LPFVSVIVPVRNEERFIGPCLEALAAQDYPRERFEVIVLDGESTDGTLREAEATARRMGVPDAFFTNHKRTTASAMNKGLSLSRGEIIIKVDGHTRVDPAFVSAGVRALQLSGADVAGGPIRTLGQGVVGRAIALAMSSPFGVGDSAFRHSQREQWAETVPFGAYRRDVFERIGGFAEDIYRGEDDELSYRLRDAGGRILLTPSIGSEYYARSTYLGLAKQYWGYGIAKMEVLRRHPRRLRPRHLVPAAFLLVLGSGTLLSLIEGRFIWLVAIVGGAYAIANAAASLRIAARGHWLELPFLPPAFATIHLSAGAGMLAGLLRRLRTSARHRDE
jgi:cellulose synthase/poly-beta-1,6-N-acetylglucosamine synthase-like glycosyltransferase